MKHIDKMIPFLSLKDVTALHGAEINEAVTRVVNSGWYLQGEENARYRHKALHRLRQWFRCSYLDIPCIY